MKRTKLSERKLPDYTKGEELMNLVTHIAGGVLGIAVLVLCLCRAAARHNFYGVVGSAIYGGSMIFLYTMSSVYHGLKPGTGKKVMQVLDHCTIYVLIAATYTVIALSALRPAYPALGWGMFIFQWAMGAVAITLTAIDLKKYNAFSMVCYIGMGWAILPFVRQVMDVLTPAGFGWLLAGGIAYTVGAVLYGIGAKKHWMHSVFHIFVVLGSALQFVAVYFYGL